MAIHVIEQDAFFAASIPLGDQQRALILPENRPVSAGDELYLRSGPSEINWVAEVQDVRQMAGPAALAGVNDAAAQTYLIIGYLARIHPGTLPIGRANLKAPWVTLNSRTLPNALPWRPGGVLVYHHTLHLIDAVLTEEQLETALAEGSVVMHRTKHYVTVTGEGRKRLLLSAFDSPLACSLCGAPFSSIDDATLDHRIPTSQGGPDVLANLQLAHKSCNELKGNALPEQYPPLFAPPGERPAHMRRNGRARKRTVATRPVIVTDGATAGQAAKPAARQAAPADAAAAKPPTKQTAKRQPAAKVAAATQPADGAAEEPATKKATTRKTTSRKTAAAKKAGASKTAAQADAAEADAKGAAAKAPATSPPEADAPMAEVAAAAEPATVNGAVAPAGDPDSDWLDTVISSGWHGLLKLASSADWAARTAALRTMVQVRRTQADPARKDGVLLADHTGPQGRYRLLEWKGNAVLCEESEDGNHMFQVPMLQSLTPDVYVWHLSQFGRRTPLQVTMHLRPFWSGGQPDDHGRILARKDERTLVLAVDGDQLVECRWLETDPQVA